MSISSMDSDSTVSMLNGQYEEIWIIVASTLCFQAILSVTNNKPDEVPWHSSYTLNILSSWFPFSFKADLSMSPWSMAIDLSCRDLSRVQKMKPVSPTPPRVSPNSFETIVVHTKHIWMAWTVAHISYPKTFRCWILYSVRNLRKKLRRRCKTNVHKCHCDRRDDEVGRMRHLVDVCCTSRHSAHRAQGIKKPLYFLLGFLYIVIYSPLRKFRCVNARLLYREAN